MIALTFAAVVVMAAGADTLPQGQARDEDLRWRMSLQEKARVIQQGIADRHMLEGTYVPYVPIPADGSPVDQTTTANSSDMHASTWTGCYLLAAAFRYGWAKTHGSPEDVAASLDLTGQLLHGIDVLTHVSGTAGLLTREVRFGHGPAVEERQGVLNANDEWHQGKGEYSDFRYRSHPSHHNYHHVLRGLAALYYMLQKDNPNPSVTEKDQLTQIVSLYREMMDFAYKSHDLVLMNDDGRVSTNLIWGVTKGQPSTRGIMATNSLKFGSWITGDSWYQRKYEELVDFFGYRQAGNVPPDRWQPENDTVHSPDHDDTEHTLASLWLMCQIEKAPDLLAFYRMAAGSIFESKKSEKRSPFNYFYAGTTGDIAGADMPGALETLQLYPTVTLTMPFMHSVRSDVEFATSSRLATAKVLPFNEQPLDNSYDWKGDPYIADRWLARQITALAVSDEDPMVWYLSDSGGTLYQSLDGGRSFSTASFYKDARVCGITFVGGRSRNALLATDRGVFRTDRGGYQNAWDLVTVGTTGAAARQVVTDSRNPNVAWAVMDDGIYRSVDLGPREAGKVWERATAPLPAGKKVVYGLSAGAHPVAYATIEGRIHRSTLAEGVEARWAISPVNTEDYHIIPTFRQVVVTPDSVDSVCFLLDLNVWEARWPMVLRTRDGGQTVSVVGWQLPRPYLPSEGSGLAWSEISRLTPDPATADVIYGASPKGVYRSRDGGLTWQLCNTGLRIPCAYEVFAPKQMPGKVYVTTPSGLHVSTDQGDTWSKPILVLNGLGVDRVDRGGMGFLVGYWPGRYFGFISDEQNSAPPPE